MHLLDPYFFVRDIVWWLGSSRAYRIWRKTREGEYLVIPELTENQKGDYEFQTIHIRPTGEMKGVVRTESEGEIIFREFYFNHRSLISVLEYGWVVDFFLPSRAMVRWRNEIDTSVEPFRRRGNAKYFSLADPEVLKVSEKIWELSRKKKP